MALILGAVYLADPVINAIRLCGIGDRPIPETEMELCTCLATTAHAQSVMAQLSPAAYLESLATEAVAIVQANRQVTNK